MQLYSATQWIHFSSCTQHWLLSNLLVVLKSRDRNTFWHAHFCLIVSLCRKSLKNDLKLFGKKPFFPPIAFPLGFFKIKGQLLYADSLKDFFYKPIVPLTIFKYIEFCKTLSRLAAYYSYLGKGHLTLWDYKFINKNLKTDRKNTFSNLVKFPFSSSTILQVYCHKWYFYTNTSHIGCQTAPLN